MASVGENRKPDQVSFEQAVAFSLQLPVEAESLRQVSQATAAESHIGPQSVSQAVQVQSLRACAITSLAGHRVPMPLFE